MTKIALALNVADPAKALEWLGRLGRSVDCYKLQMDLFGRGGPELIKQFVNAGTDVFLDLKFHDIPSVVGSAVRVAGEMGVRFVTVHTTGGAKMMAEAAKASAAFGARRPLILGVTVLTSLDAADLERVTGCRQSVEERVLALARLAKESGCDGAVCSPHEIGVVRSACGPEFLIVTPGIRMGRDMTGTSDVPDRAPGPKDDQARTLTPAQAARAGADYIVIGRPIYDAPDPLKAVAEIRAQLKPGDATESSDAAGRVPDPLLAAMKQYGVLREGHFLLTSGRHSGRYFEKFRILEHPAVCGQFAHAVAEHFRPRRITVVCGPTTGGIIIAYEVARQLGCRSIIAEKADTGRRIGRGFQVGPEDRVLVVDDVMTTGGSIRETLDALAILNAGVAGVGVYVDRSPGVDFGVPFFAAYRQQVATYEPAQCPLCKTGALLEAPGRGSSK